MSGRRIKRIALITTLAVVTFGCPLPFEYNGPGAGNSHSSDPSTPSMTAPVIVSYSEQGGTSGTIADGSAFVSGLTTTVTLSTATENAIIYYYIDGGSPLTNLGSAKKIGGSSGTITLTRTTSPQSLDIRAIAIGTNMLPSPAVHATVSVSPYPILSVTRDKASVSEDGGTATFTITSSSAPASNITVNLMTSGNYVAADLTGLSAPGPFTATLTQSMTTITLPITGVHDASNVDRTVTLTIQPDSNTPPAYTVGAPASASVLLKDDGVPTYTVTYSGNGSTGGAVPTDGNAYQAGATVTVLSPGTLSLSTGVFAGWNTSTNGSGTTYSGGNTFAMGAGNVTLFAIWLPVTGTTITSVPLSTTGVVIPEGVTDFGMAFRNHPNLKSVTIPSSVTTVIVQAFLGCTQLSTMVSNNARYKVINGALVDTTTNTLMLVPAKLSGAFIIPPSVTNIDPYAFDSCTNLTAITIPPSLTTISMNGFSGLRSAIPITIPSTVTAITSFGFYNCSVTSITIPASISSIGTSAMGLCGGLSNVYMQSGTPPTLGTTVFSAPLPIIHVPNAAAVLAYQADSSWSASGVSIVTP